MRTGQWKNTCCPTRWSRTPPIGVKLVFERWISAGGEAFWKVRLVYQSTAQLRSQETLTLDNPPMEYTIRFEGVSADENGLIAEADLFALLDGAIDEYDVLVETYADEEAEAA